MVIDKIYSYDDGNAYVVSDDETRALLLIQMFRISCYHGKVEYVRDDNGKYTWDDLYALAMNTGFGNAWLRAKDVARSELRRIILRKEGIDIEDDEIPEESIDSFLDDYPKNIYFDKYGSFLVEKVKKEGARL